GPWAKNSQVWDAEVAPQKTRQVVLSVGEVTAEEARQVKAALERGPETPPPGKAAVVRDEKTFRVQAPRYEATVEGDGCLTSLRAGGVEWLHTDEKVGTRGAYFFLKEVGALKLPT